MRVVLIFLLLLYSSSANAQPIFDAVRSGNSKAIDSLFQVNSSCINEINKDGFTPLVIAVYRGQNNAAERLIMLGAEVDVFTPEGTALHASCYTNNQVAAALLIRAGANVNALTENNTSPLHYAVATNNTDLVQLLMDHGADPLVEDSSGFSPTDLASSKRMKRILK